MNLIDKNDCSFLINTAENEEVCKKLSAKEESTLNGTLYEKKSNAQEKNTKEYTSVVSDNEEDDCISLFAESFAEFTSQ